MINITLIPTNLF